MLYQEYIGKFLFDIAIIGDMRIVSLRQSAEPVEVLSKANRRLTTNAINVGLS